ncbi:hypothetical protein GCM10010277_82700 [Streptomyces longisporoflavus]|nr:hypothetical protein GCM10010277_82700 [Streptomyces longisporoflavus]
MTKQSKDNQNEMDDVRVRASDDQEASEASEDSGTGSISRSGSKYLLSFRT